MYFLLWLSLFSDHLCFLSDRPLFFLFTLLRFIFYKKVIFYVLVTNILMQLLIWHLDLTQTKGSKRNLYTRNVLDIFGEAIQIIFDAIWCISHFLEVSFRRINYIQIYLLSFVKYYLNDRDILENSSSQPMKKSLKMNNLKISIAENGLLKRTPIWKS